MSLCVVTATTNRVRAKPCLDSWGEVQLIVIENGGAAPYLGTVPAFRRGVDQALEAGYTIIACLHDDLVLHDPHWVEKVETHVAHHPACGLLGFGGGIGLGADDLYCIPYNPIQLARIGFRSNLVDAEAHGIRSLRPERVACLDGFSQVGTRAFWEGQTSERAAPWLTPPWTVLDTLGVVHHAYDGMLGVLAARSGWEVWYLPIRATHLGGQTAVGDPGYSHWAETAHGGDRALWEQAHRQFYALGRGLLPIRL